MLSARRLSDFVRLQAAVSHGLATGLATWPEVTTKSVDGISVEPVGFNSRFLPDFLGKKDHLSSLWLRFTVFFLTKSHHPIMGSTWYKVVRLSEVHHAMCFQWLTWTMRWIEMIYPWASSLPWLFAKPSVHIITDPKPIGCITPAWSSWLASECDYRPYTDLSQVPLHHQAMKFWSKLWLRNYKVPSAANVPHLASNKHWKSTMIAGVMWQSVWLRLGIRSSTFKGSSEHSELHF